VFDNEGYVYLGVVEWCLLLSILGSDVACLYVLVCGFSEV